MPEVVVFKSLRKSKYSIPDVNKELFKQMEQVAKQIKDTYEQTTEGWQHKVKFEALTDVQPNGPTVLVGTDDKIYGYVDKGTRRHVIMAGAFTGRSKKRFLVFKENYRPATIPNVLYSFKALSYGKTIRARVVLHPGTKARNFTEMIQKQWTKKFKDIMQTVVNNYAQRINSENQ